jgi:hypothetical protein
VEAAEAPSARPEAASEELPGTKAVARPAPAAGEATSVGLAAVAEAAEVAVVGLAEAAEVAVVGLAAAEVAVEGLAAAAEVAVGGKPTLRSWRRSSRCSGYSDRCRTQSVRCSGWRCPPDREMSARRKTPLWMRRRRSFLGCTARRSYWQ